jgi:hypothetical protein
MSRLAEGPATFAQPLHHCPPLWSQVIKRLIHGRKQNFENARCVILVNIQAPEPSFELAAPHQLANDTMSILKSLLAIG